MDEVSGTSRLKGLCGDTIEFYLIIENNIVTKIKYYTDGCVFTKTCCQTAARLALRESISEILRISPQQIIEEVKFLPKNHMHCSILTVSSLHQAIADYLLKS